MSFLSITSHILDSNGVWYCSFWSEGSMNPLNMNIWVLDFVPRDLARPRTWYIKWRRGGISNGTFECLHCCEKCLSNSHSRVCATVQKGNSSGFNPPTFSSMGNCLDYDRLALSHLNTKVFIFTSFFSEIWSPTNLSGPVQWLHFDRSFQRWYQNHCPTRWGRLPYKQGKLI